MIARPPERANDLLFRWLSPPSPSDTVRVGEGDSCVTIQFGTVLGTFAPGDHRLPAEIPEGVELWYCSTRPFLDKKFGGRLPTGATLFGTYSYAVSTPHLLVLAGVAAPAPGTGTMNGLLEYLSSTVLTALTTAFGTEPPSPANMGNATHTAQKAIEATWAPLGLRFIGFGTLSAR